jgi:predicted ATPase/transcriptional regulator with XRE-family HTH domain
MFMSATDAPILLTSFTSFGDLLKYLRRRARLTQRELSIAVGYSEGQINRLEKNQRKPDVITLLATFVPALGLEDEPTIVARLTELAAAARKKSTATGPAHPQHVTLPTREESGEVEQTAAEKPLRLHAPLYRLPNYLTTFMGREQEMMGITRLLARARLITLTGAGGIGKTRIAIEVGAVIGESFADGVCLVELAPLSDPVHVPQSVVAALHIPEQPGRIYSEALITYLTDKHLLLILDNCEHLIAACADLAERLLHACPRLHILATSREVLRLPGETVWRMSALATPDPATPLPVERISEYAAIRLFVQHAMAAQPKFLLTDGNATAVAQICHRLDGMPLAIEMAAAQVAGLSTEEIVAGLEDRFVLLTSGSRTALPRQQTLRATLDWSYALLPSAEQKLLARLSVFVGGWMVEAAKAVCGGELSVLLQLVQKSLVSVERTGRQTRYRMLETIREYAGEKLRALEETAAISERHLAYFVALAEETMDLGGRHVDSWVKRVEAEHDNLRVAFAWARTRDDSGEMMLRLAGGLRSFRHHRGFSNEGLMWLNEALARGSHAPPLARAKALLAKATLLAIVWGDEHQLSMLAEESLRLFEEANEPLGVAWSREILSGATPFSIGRARTEQIARQAYSLFQELGCLAGICRVLRGLSGAALDRGDDAQAEALCEEALAIAQQIDDTMAAASALSRLSLINPSRAVVLSAQEVARWREAGNPEYLAASLQFYGEFLLIIGEVQLAEAALYECLTLWQQLERRVAMVTGIAPTLRLLGIAAYLRRDSKAATVFYRQASKLHQEAGGLYSVQVIRLLIASAAMLEENYAAAWDNLRACLLHFQLLGDRLTSALVLAQLAELARMQGLSQRSATLLGAAARFERDVKYAFHMGVIGVLRRNFAQAIATGRARLVDPDFAAAWAEGQALTLDEAVAYALEGSR